MAIALSYRSLSNDSTASEEYSSSILNKLSQKKYYIPLGSLLTVILLLLSSGTTPAAVVEHASAAKDTLLAYTSSNGRKPAHGLPYGPADLEAAVAKSEEAWRRNLDKRIAFIESKGGLQRMTPFEFKPKKNPAWIDAQSALTLEMNISTGDREVRKLTYLPVCPVWTVW